MRTFKDFLKNDAKIFINPQEFGDLVFINGSPANVMIDDEELEKRNLARSSGLVDDKLAKSDLLFYIESDFFDHIPQANRLIDFNGKKYRIDSASNDMGILTIVASRNSG